LNFCTRQKLACPPPPLKFKSVYAPDVDQVREIKLMMIARFSTASRSRNEQRNNNKRLVAFYHCTHAATVKQ